MSVQNQTIFVIGECMVELRRESTSQAGGLRYRFGGDTLNAAVYLSRSLAHAQTPFQTAYVSALGTDALSDEMCAVWEEEGVATQWVQRLPNKLPGMYLIETDAAGERRFQYWRNDSAARFWLRGPRADEICAALRQAALIYLSGISLAILVPEDRSRLFEVLAACRAQGGKIVFDNNYRPRLWTSREEAVEAYRRVLQLSDTALLTLDDEEALYGDKGVDAAISRARTLGVREVVIKRGAESCIVQEGEVRTEVSAEPVARVVDTTAAGDSFGAAYLAARLAGKDMREAARAGHRLAAKVIQYAGAIIPRSAMFD